MSRDADRKPGISMRTLAIASAASATATAVVPMLWRPGTLPAAAVTPIVVALVTEFLNRPKLPITRVAPIRDRRLRRGRGAEPAAAPAGGDRFGLRSADRRRRLARIAIVTGLLAFLVVAAVWTVGELAAGESLSGGERTTYFGGEAAEPAATPTPAPGEQPQAPAPGQEQQDAPADPQATPASPTATPEGTATPAPTASPEPAPETTPAPAAP